MVPAGHGYPFAIGNTATCEVQAFLSTALFLSTTMSYAMLSLTCEFFAEMSLVVSVHLFFHHYCCTIPAPNTFARLVNHLQIQAGERITILEVESLAFWVPLGVWRDLGCIDRPSTHHPL